MGGMEIISQLEISKITADCKRFNTKKNNPASEGYEKLCLLGELS